MNALSNENHTQRNKLKFHGSGENWFPIWLVNILLSFITFGIYSAWAKVRTNRYFYGNTELAGDRFDYHAKPTQILLGRILVIVGVIVFYTCLLIAPPLALIMLLTFLALVPWILIRSWRFEAIMSSYRGVRFNYHCHFGRAYMTFLVWPVLAFLTLFILLSLGYGLVAATGMEVLAMLLALFVIPGFVAVNGVLSAVQHDLYVNNMFFGNSAFKGVMKKAAFVKFSLVSMLLALPFVVLIGMLMASFIFNLVMMSDAGASDEIMGDMVAENIGTLFLVYLLILAWGTLARAYLTVAHRNYLFNQTTLNDGKISLHSSLKLLPYLWLLFTNAMIICLSAGIATPFAQVRHARYMVETVEVEGDIDTLAVQAHTDTAQSALAEELVQELDLSVAL